MNRIEIAVLARNKAVVAFLEGFFRSRKAFAPAYYKTAENFLKDVNGNSPSAVLAESALLRQVSDRITKSATLSVISGDVRKGIEDSISCCAKNYVYEPFLERDLEYKLENLVMEQEVFRQMENEMRELEAIVDLTQLITETLDPKELLFRIVTKVAELIPVTRCSVIKVDWLHKSAYVVSTFEDPYFRGMKLNLKKYPEIVEAFTKKKPIVIRDVATYPLMANVRDILEPLGIRSILVLPMIFREKVIGTLFLRTSRVEHEFSENEIRLLNSLANASANVLYNAFLFERVEDEKSRLEKLAITDFLTGVFNIRYFYHRIIEEFSRCLRYSLPIGCLMLDIDHFKAVNDQYGHKTGDQVLKEFAQLLRKHSRKSDVFARYGGEEFILLLPQTAEKGAVAEAERLRKTVMNHSFKSLKSKGLTVSVGVSVYPHESVKTHDELIARADTALFTAKHNGRNQVALFQS